jgi:peptidoglycan hydrolase CwlO-like protein
MDLSALLQPENPAKLAHQRILASTLEELAMTQVELDTVHVDLITSQAELAVAQADLATAQVDLIASQAELTVTQTDLAIAQAELVALRNQLALTQAELEAAKTDPMKQGKKKTQPRLKNNEERRMRNRISAHNSRMRQKEKMRMLEETIQRMSQNNTL